MTDFAVFILSYGRPECITYSTLRNNGYTGKIYILTDTTDKKLGEYKENYGLESVLVFDKLKYVDRVDRHTNAPILHTVLYARQAVFDIAKQLNIVTFLCLDDDITAFKARYVQDDKLKNVKLAVLDNIFDAVNQYFSSVPISILGFACSRTYFGGKNGTYAEKVRFDFCVAYFCKTDDIVQFDSVCYEDACASILNQRNGKICFEILDICQDSTPTGENTTGGMSQFYSDSKYQAGMYTVLSFPDCLRLRENFTLRYDRNGMVPKIISSSFRKEK